MDTSQQVAVIPQGRESSVAAQRQWRRIAEKRRIVEETLVEGASVARVARAHGVNANQVFGWRRLYLAGRLGDRKPGMVLAAGWGERELCRRLCRWSVVRSMVGNDSRARSTSNYGRRRCGSKAAPTRRWCGCWLLEGIDWRRPVRTGAPSVAV